MMTLNQTERLVRKIAEAASQPASDTQTAKLAQDYAEVCRAANRRLEQCAIMIEAGQFLQALQLAETPPPLLDLITLLAFRQAAEWRNYCQAHQLPWTEPFYDKYIRLLNNAYGKGIASDHPFYRDYRRAVMENDDCARLVHPARHLALESFRREHQGGIETAGGKNVAGQTGKPASGRGHGRSRRHSGRLATTGGLRACPCPPHIRSGSKRRSPVASKCSAAQKNSASRVSGRTWNQWSRKSTLWPLVTIFVCPTPTPIPGRPWRNGLRNSARPTRQNRIFKRAVSALEYEVQTIASQRATGVRLNKAAAASAYDTLEGKLREAERFGKPLAEDLVGQCQECSDWLQKQIRSANRRQSILSRR
jgi:hypothetical protein